MDRYLAEKEMVSARMNWMLYSVQLRKR